MLTSEDIARGKKAALKRLGELGVVIPDGEEDVELAIERVKRGVIKEGVKSHANHEHELYSVTIFVIPRTRGKGCLCLLYAIHLHFDSEDHLGVFMDSHRHQLKQKLKRRMNEGGLNLFNQYIGTLCGADSEGGNAKSRRPGYATIQASTMQSTRPWTFKWLEENVDEKKWFLAEVNTICAGEESCTRHDLKNALIAAIRKLRNETLDPDCSAQPVFESRIFNAISGMIDQGLIEKRGVGIFTGLTEVGREFITPS